jgi:DNA-directed RNA polymerase subunit K/omega
MLYPSMSSLLKRINSRYLLVNVIAKRSRISRRRLYGTRRGP